MRELDIDKIDQICHAVHKPGRSLDGHQITELAVTHLQLTVSYLAIVAMRVYLSMWTLIRSMPSRNSTNSRRSRRPTTLMETSRP